MHDPMTVAHEIKLPFGGIKSTFKDGRVLWHRPAIVTIWHVDPETDGGDDSCGWTWRKDPEANDLMTKAESEGRSEWKFMCGEHGYAMAPLEMVYSAWGMVAWRFFRRRNLTNAEINEVLSLAINPADNLRRMAERALQSEEEMGHFFRAIMRIYLRQVRPWWKHPRWHIHHWQVQVPIVQNLKRWLFSRCARCGKRFPWGYAPVTNQWDGTGPLWFKSETDVYHHDCIHPAVAAAGMSVEMITDAH